MSELALYLIGGISFLTSLAILGWLNSAYLLYMIAFSRRRRQR